MYSPLVCYYKASPNNSGPRGRSIDTITIHCMAGNGSIESCGGLFAQRSYGASSNYGIGSDGRIACYVDEDKVSWCSSNSANDRRAVTIEVANCGGAPDWPVSDAAYAALIRLLVDVCKRNGIKRLLWKGDKSLVGQVELQNMTVHRWFAAKACPGDYLYSRHGDIAEKVNKILEDDKMQAKRYQTLADIPEWGRETIKGLIDAGKLKGRSEAVDEDGYPAELDLSDDMLRILMIMAR